MNDIMLWAKVSRYYELLKVVVDMKDSGSWAHDSRSYEQLKVVVNMNDSWSFELSPLDAMNPSRL